MEPMENKELWDHLAQVAKMADQENQDLKVSRVCLVCKETPELLVQGVNPAKMDPKDRPVSPVYRESVVRMETQEQPVRLDLPEKQDPEELPDSEVNKVSLDYLVLLERLVNRANLESKDLLDPLDH